MSFTIKCDNCGSEDVSISDAEDVFNCIEIWAYCKDCKNSEEISR